MHYSLRPLLSTASTALFVTLQFLLGSVSSYAAPTPTDIPPQLQPWVPWVKHRVQELPCTITASGELCAWPAHAQLRLGDKGGEFSLSVTMQKPGRITLPGDENAWPQKVTTTRSSQGAVEQELPIAVQSGAPIAYLSEGVHLVKGTFAWDSPPGVIRVPSEIAIVNLSVSGKEVDTFERPADGTISLRELLSSQPTNPESEVSISVFRLIEDGIPFKVTTRAVINVASERLQVTLPDPSPIGASLSGVTTSAPYFTSESGDITFALQSGTHIIDLLSISPKPLSEIKTKQENANWPNEEIWAWKEARELRVTSLSGGTPIDPHLTSLPSEWTSYPTFSLSPGTTITIDEGDVDGRKKKLGAVTLQRRLTQDLSGNGYTIEDRLVGTLGGSGRLNMLSPTELGAAEMRSEPLLITTDSTSGLRGIEVRQQQFEATARSRLETATDEIPVVGWDRDVDWLKVTFQLPTWKEVLWVKGADATIGTRISAWNLGSVFLLALISILAGKVLGLLGGGATLLCFTLLHGEGANLLDLYVLLLIGIPFLKREKNSVVWGAAYVAVLLWMVVNAYLFVSNDIMSRLHPDHSASTTRAANVPLHFNTSPPSSNSFSGGSGSIKYNDSRISTATNTVLTYAEGTFGALIMVVCGVIAFVCLVLRKFKSAGLAAAAFIAAFCLRSMMSTFFNDDSITSMTRQESQYENYNVIANNLGIQTDSSQLQQFASVGTSIESDALAGAPADAEIAVTRKTTRVQSRAPSSAASSLVTQSGPGIPQWEGREVTLTWEGAVPRGHTISLVTLSFGAGLLLAGVRGALLLVLILLIWKAAPPQIAELLQAIRRPRRLASTTATTTVALILSFTLSVVTLLISLTHSSFAQDTFPPEKLLTELEERIKVEQAKEHPCSQDCISTESLHLSVKSHTLEGSALVHSIGRNSWLLPALPQRAVLKSLTLNGAAVTAASRSESGTMLLLENGVHRITFAVPLVPQTPATLTLAQLAGRLTTHAEGYRIFTEKTPSGTIVQFLPEGEVKEVSNTRRSDITPWYTVTRRILVGADITTELLINRIGDLTKDGALEVSLLNGERILDSGVKRRDGGIVVTTKAGESDTITYTGLIPNPEGFITLEAPLAAKYSEDWVIQCTAQWRCTFEGLQPTEKFENGQAFFHFTPRPGEKTKFSLTKLNGASGATQTVLQAHTQYEPSSHFLRSTLTMAIKAGQSGSQRISVPETAQIKEIKLNNRDVLDITDTNIRPLELSVLKGTHVYKVVWQEPTEISTAPQFTPVNLHGEYSNGSSTFKIPTGWLPIFARPGQLGPYLGIVSFIIIELLLFLVLSLILPLPLPRWQALVILIGATLLGPLGAHLTCGWIFFCGVVQRLGNIESEWLSSVSSTRAFTAVRICTVLLPIGALAALTAFIFNSSPNLQLLGAGSSRDMLTWYIDRGSELLPTPSLIMIPNVIWQIALLVWGIVVALLAFRIVSATLTNNGR